MKDNIDYEKVRNFYEKKAKYSRPSDLTLVATTQPDDPPGFLFYRDKAHKRHLFKALKVRKDWTVLDMGCGAGRWTFTFAERCKFVIGVDNSKSLLELAEEEAMTKSVHNVKFINSSIIDFSCPEKFDLVFFGAVLMYINDRDLLRVMANIKELLRPGGMVGMLESISVSEKVVVNSVYYKGIETPYSVIYRKSEEYRDLFTRNGFKIEYENEALARSPALIFYKHFVPALFRKNELILTMLKLGLNIQAYLDPYLVKFKVAGERAETHQKFFIFRSLN